MPADRKFTRLRATGPRAQDKGRLRGPAASVASVTWLCGSVSEQAEFH